MIIHYFSDPHVDFWRADQRIDDATMLKLLNIKQLPEKRCRVLIIAGDLGHSNAQNQRMLWWLNEYIAEEIIFVFGNHDYYLLQDYDKKHFSNSLERIDAMKAWADKQPQIHCLDGTVVEIDGIRVGGAMGWYDGSYFYQNLLNSPYSPTLQSVWKNSMNDSKYIYGCCDNFDDLWSIERLKLEAVYQECDVMVTHINPSPHPRHSKEEWRKDISCAFYSFAGDEYVANGSAKHWLYGHNHVCREYEWLDVHFHVNAIGYRKENQWKRSIKSFEI